MALDDQPYLLGEHMMNSNDATVSSNLLAAGLFGTAAALDEIKGSNHAMIELFRFCSAALALNGIDIDALIDEALDPEIDMSVALLNRAAMILDWSENHHELDRLRKDGKYGAAEELSALALSLGKMINMVTQGLPCRKGDPVDHLLRDIRRTIDRSRCGQLMNDILRAN
jgi:hypothetical protein